MQGFRIFMDFSDIFCLKKVSFPKGVEFLLVGVCVDGSVPSQVTCRKPRRVRDNARHGLV